ncbi:hypothetical protein M427DRAFT_471853 [Gonapodya prolifera JEL478]|uniref:Uncharacterized protein n=1 Tax=Gonapodya prolifera (strain JEL478) TaxID=1344416 RepID=A0A139AR66_GONPJ|nr:hypothetical protein M427DRAFT_471853 [Gonapodya prolifera JEL478]|eukprot:KXS19219.1 hypothetical protein M427DRAFT_471853 [Gonapodya prolifera JEL478]
MRRHVAPLLDASRLNALFAPIRALLVQDLADLYVLTRDQSLGIGAGPGPARKTPLGNMYQTTLDEFITDIVSAPPDPRGESTSTAHHIFSALHAFYEDHSTTPEPTLPPLPRLALYALRVLLLLSTRTTDPDKGKGRASAMDVDVVDARSAHAALVVDALARMCAARSAAREDQLVAWQKWVAARVNAPAPQPTTMSSLAPLVSKFAAENPTLYATLTRRLMENPIHNPAVLDLLHHWQPPARPLLDALRGDILSRATGGDARATARALTWAAVLCGAARHGQTFVQSFGGWVKALFADGSLAKDARGGQTVAAVLSEVVPHATPDILRAIMHALSNLPSASTRGELSAVISAVRTRMAAMGMSSHSTVASIGARVDARSVLDAFAASGEVPEQLNHAFLFNKTFYEKSLLPSVLNLDGVWTADGMPADERARREELRYALAAQINKRGMMVGRWDDFERARTSRQQALGIASEDVQIRTAPGRREDRVKLVSEVFVDMLSSLSKGNATDPEHDQTEGRGWTLADVLPPRSVQRLEQAMSGDIHVFGDAQLMYSSEDHCIIVVGSVHRDSVGIVNTVWERLRQFCSAAITTPSGTDDEAESQLTQVVTAILTQLLRQPAVAAAFTLRLCDALYSASQSDTSCVLALILKVFSSLVPWIPLDNDESARMLYLDAVFGPLLRGTLCCEADGWNSTVEIAQMVVRHAKPGLKMEASGTENCDETHPRDAGSIPGLHSQAPCDHRDQCFSTEIVEQVGSLWERVP